MYGPFQWSKTTVRQAAALLAMSRLPCVHLTFVLNLQFSVVVVAARMSEKELLSHTSFSVYSSLHITLFFFL